MQNYKLSAEISNGLKRNKTVTTICKSARLNLRCGRKCTKRSADAKLREKKQRIKAVPLQRP